MTMALSICIEMPSGMSSTPRTHWKDKALTDESILELLGIYTKQMKQWLDFEAYIVLFEDNHEISREHIKT